MEFNFMNVALFFFKSRNLILAKGPKPTILQVLTFALRPDCEL